MVLYILPHAAPNQTPKAEDGQIPSQKAQIGEQGLPAGEGAAEYGVKKGKPNKKRPDHGTGGERDFSLGCQGGEDVQQGLQRHIEGKETGQRLPGWRREAG